MKNRGENKADRFPLFTSLLQRGAFITRLSGVSAQ
jgi:hypothetical protein